MKPRISGGQLDAALGLLLFAATVLYLAAFPLNLFSPDEAHGLLAAKRVFDGEVMYRDVFDLFTPGWIMMMAGLFGVFGPTLATARLTVAVLHGGTALMLFLACRRLGVRRGLAWACGFAYLVVCQPMLPIATYHWLATLLCAVLLAICVRPTASVSWAFLVGGCVGLLISVHQHRGLSMGLGAAAIIIAQPLIERHYRTGRERGIMWRQLGAFAGGIALVVGPLLAALVATAGVQPVWNALVIVPLVNYRGNLSCPWGLDITRGGRSPVSPFLKYLPATLAVSVLPLLALLWRRHDPERVRSLTVLTLLCGSAILSIFYFPDTIHIALIAGLFFVTWADALERAVRLLPTSLAMPFAGTVTAAVVLVGCTELSRNLIALRARYTIAYQSAFGRVDLDSPRPGWDQIRKLLDSEPSRELYVYPAANYSHLLFGAHNPVRFAFISQGSYTSPDQIEEIVNVLTAKRVPYVLVTPYVMRSDDRIARYIREHYEWFPQLPLPLWRRKDGETRADANAKGASRVNADLPAP